MGSPLLTSPHQTTSPTSRLPVSTQQMPNCLLPRKLLPRLLLPHPTYPPHPQGWAVLALLTTTMGSLGTSQATKTGGVRGGTITSRGGTRAATQIITPTTITRTTRGETGETTGMTIGMITGTEGTGIDSRTIRDLASSGWTGGSARTRTGVCTRTPVGRACQ